jgi:hypothetical protein
VADNPRRVDGQDRITTAVRVFTTRKHTKTPTEKDRPERERKQRQRVYPHEALVFDTETLPGPAQQLRFLVWRFYRDPPGTEPGVVCIEEGIAYPDDLPTTAPADWKRLQRYTSTRTADVAAGFAPALRLEPVSWWLDERLYRYGWAHRDRCAVVGFNLLFDLGRVASYWGEAGGFYRGGFSLGLWGGFDATGKWHERMYRPRLRAKALDPRRTLFGWATRMRKDPDEPRGGGRFVDLRTLAFALTDRSHTLESASTAFGDPYEKRDVDYTRLSDRLLDYALDDIRHTSVLYRNCHAELARHDGVRLEPHRLYSPATVGTQYLEAFGLRRPLAKFTALTAQELGWDEPGTKESAIADDEPRGNLDPAILGYAMSAFYGGRAEARIVRTELPIVLVDFTSMYPSVNALLGTWPLLCADRLTVRDVTKATRQLVADPDLLDRCLTPDLWRDVGVTLVEIEPDGDLLPTRAHYDPAGADYTIALNPLTYQGRLWYMLPDVLAATILNPTQGKTTGPRIVRALRLEAEGVQEGLGPVALRGGERIDPASDDPFVRMIEERQRVLADETLSKEERDRLQLFLKITANATAYGVLARFDRREPGRDKQVTVYGPDPEPVQRPIPAPEDPGPYCFPPVAAAITAAARLMLALLERLVRDAGGQYAFCDTDSMAIVATPRGRHIPCPTANSTDTIRALSFRDVDAIRARFQALNPYDPALVPTPWKVEADSMNRPLHCYVISAKRYCLYRDALEEVEIVAAVDTSEEAAADTDRTAFDDQLADWSEHGLGLYLDPTSDDPDRPRRDDHGRRVWIAEAWQWILAGANGEQPPLPAWADRYALTRFTISSPHLEDWFKGYNQDRPWAEKIRPGSFGLIGHPTALTARALPTATYEPDPDRWPDLDWYDRRTGNPIHVTTLDPGDDPDQRAHTLQRGDTPIQRLHDTLTTYRHRPEPKSLDPTGGPAGPTSRGLLQRRPVTSSPTETELTGKEGNRLIERASGETTDPAEYRNTYGTRTELWSLVVDILREIGVPTIVAQTSFSRSAVYSVLNGATPRTDHARVYIELAAAQARARFAAWNVQAASELSRLLGQYTQERNERRENTRHCEWCTKPIPDDRRKDARFCSARCRQAAARAASLTASEGQAKPPWRSGDKSCMIGRS